MIARMVMLLRSIRILPFLLSLVFGSVTTWVVLNLSNGPAVVILGQAEAEGQQFSNPNQLDIVTKFRRNRVCPSVSQRFVWRWTSYDGDRVQQIIALPGPALPFLADSQTTILTIPNPGVPDLNDHWYFRTVIDPRCSWVPTFISKWFGTRMFRSPDLPVNFVGEPHEAAPK